MDPFSVALGLAQFAPSIMRFFGAGEKPAAVAEKIGEIAKTVTGTNSPEEALTAMRQNAEKAQQFSLAVLAADTELETAYLADRTDARKRDIEVRKLDGGRNVRADVMVLLDVLGIIACLVVISLYREDIPGEVIGMLGTIVGIFGAGLRDAHQFEFGSSRGSKTKDADNADLLAKLAAK